MTEPEPPAPSNVCIVCPRMSPKSQPRLYDRKDVCERCRVWLVDMLNQVVDYYALLPYTLRRAMTAGQMVSGGGSEAMLPFLEDVWDLLGPVARETVSDPLGDQIGYLSVATTLDAWTSMWAEKRAMGEVGPGVWVSEQTGWLANRIQWACDHAAESGVDDFAGELANLVHSMRRFVDTDTSKPQPLRGVPCRRCDLCTLARLGNGSGDVECQNPDCRAIMRAEEYERWTKLAAAFHRRRVKTKVVDEPS